MSCPSRRNILVGIDSINRYPPEKLVLITTGSQGEPMSALYRMAFSEHRRVEIGPNDYVIISATPIPGNEKMVGKVVDELLKQGAEVVYEKMYDVHVSGHACQEELNLMNILLADNGKEVEIPPKKSVFRARCPPVWSLSTAAASVMSAL